MHAVRRWLRLCSAILISTGLAAPCAWANYACQGTVDWVALNGNILVVNSTQAGINAGYVCAISGTANGVDADTCKAILAMLLTAHATGQTVQWAFNDALTCTTHPQWTWLTGWYTGPYVM
jgi:hypothetical protein